MNDFQAKTTFDITKCRTGRRGQTDLFDCLAEKQYLICGAALPFGRGRFCRHPQRQEFAERRLRDSAVDPSQRDTAES